jgi:hypothetical protein
VAVVKPFEEGLTLAEFRRFDCGRGLRERGGDLVQALAHLRPVLDRRSHLADHVRQTRPQCEQTVCLGLAVDLDVHDGLERLLPGPRAWREDLDELTVAVSAQAQHWVDHQVNAVALPTQLHRDRVDQERHVVADDLDHRVPRLPAVLLEVRVVEADLGLAVRALLGKAPLRERGAVEVERAAAGEVLRRHPAVVLAHKGFALCRLVGCEPLAHPLDDAVDQDRFDLIEPAIASQNIHDSEVIERSWRDDDAFEPRAHGCQGCPRKIDAARRYPDSPQNTGMPRKIAEARRCLLRGDSSAEVGEHVGREQLDLAPAILAPQLEHHLGAAHVAVPLDRRQTVRWGACDRLAHVEDLVADCSSRSETPATPHRVGDRHDLLLREPRQLEQRLGGPLDVYLPRIEPHLGRAVRHVPITVTDGGCRTNVCGRDKRPAC